MNAQNRRQRHKMSCGYLRSNGAKAALDLNYEPSDSIVDRSNGSEVGGDRIWYRSDPK